MGENWDISTTTCVKKKTTKKTIQTNNHRLSYEYSCVKCYSNYCMVQFKINKKKKVSFRIS